MGKIFRNLVERAFQTMAFALCMLLFPLASSAQTITQLFPDSVHACVLGAFRAPNVQTSIARVNMFYPDQYDVSTCDGTWTFGGASYFVTPYPGYSFPEGAPQAVWLNEAFNDTVRDGPRTRGEMTRQLDGLTEGRVYKVSVDAAWHDDSPGDTYLGLSLGAETPPPLLIQDGSVARTISAELCARSTSLLLKLYEAGTNTNGASPVLTNVRLEEKSTPCQFTVTFESNGGSAVALWPATDLPDDPTHASDVRNAGVRRLVHRHCAHHSLRLRHTRHQRHHAVCELGAGLFGGRQRDGHECRRQSGVAQ